MKIKIELELEIVISENQNTDNYIEKKLLNCINEKTGTNINNMYIDEIKIVKTEII